MVAVPCVLHECRHVFGIPGRADLGLCRRHVRIAYRIRCVSYPRHEQATAYMAWLREKPRKGGVFSVVTGPGSLNEGAAVCRLRRQRADALA